MNKNIWFTAREIYNQDCNEFGSWEKYIEWSKLSQLDELVSLDGILNSLIFEPLYDDIDNQYNIYEGHQPPSLFNSINYVKERTKDIDYYNLLAVIKEPTKIKQEILSRDFDFIGYDLIETDGNISALTNCGGFEETFMSKEQNKYGLISDYERAKEIQTQLPINNPDEQHADCYLYEVWRHKFIGRNISFDEHFCR